MNPAGASIYKEMK